MAGEGEVDISFDFGKALAALSSQIPFVGISRWWSWILGASAGLRRGGLLTNIYESTMGWFRRNGSKVIDCTCATQILLATTTSLTSWHGTSLLAWAPPTPSPPQKVSHGNGYGPPATASRLQITCATELRVETPILIISNFPRNRVNHINKYK